MDPVQPQPTSTPPPQPATPAPTAINPMAPKTKSKLLYLVIAIVLLVLAVVVIALIVKNNLNQPLQPQVTNTNSVPSLANVPVADQTIRLSQAFKSGDFSTIITYLSEKIPNSAWISQVKDTKVFYASESGQIVPSPNSISTLPSKIISSSFNPQIELDPSLKTEQPYASSAILLIALSTIYNSPKNGTLSVNECLNQLQTAFQDEMKFWNSLSTDQRTQINGYSNLQLDVINSRYQAYIANPNSLTQWVNQNLTDICQVTNISPNSTSGGNK